MSFTDDSIRVVVNLYHRGYGLLNRLTLNISCGFHLVMVMRKTAIFSMGGIFKRKTRAFQTDLKPSIYFCRDS